MSSLRNTFKSHNSFKHGRRISLSNIAEEDALHEQKPILSDHKDEQATASTSAAAAEPHHPISEVIVKIDGGSDSSASTPPSVRDVSSDSCLEFWRDKSNTPMQQGGFDFTGEDPPSKLIGKFLHKQKADGGELCLDMDLEMAELGHDNSNSSSPTKFSPLRTNNKNQINACPPTNELIKVSSSPVSIGSAVVDICPDEQDKSLQNNECSSSSSSSSSSSDEIQRVHNRRRSINTSSLHSPSNRSGNEGQVLKCTSFQKRYSRLRTRSRLIDPDPVPDRRSGPTTPIKSGQIVSGAIPAKSGQIVSGTIPAKSGQMRSGFLNRVSGVLSRHPDEEEEDPLFGEDLPDDYKKAKFDALTIVQWISLILIIAAFVTTLVVEKLKKLKLRGMSLWKWEVMVLVLICGRLVSGWLIRIIVFFIERNFFMRKRVLYFVYGVRSAVQNGIWLGLVLLSWHFVFDENVAGHRNNKFLWYVNKLMLCMLVGILLWLVKTLMVKVLASSFHVSTFFDRIHESLFNQYVIEALSGPPVVEIQHHKEEEERTKAEVCMLQKAGAVLPPDLQGPAFQGTKGVEGNGGGGAAADAGAGGRGGLPPRVPAKMVSFKISSGPLNGKSNHDDHHEGITIDQLHKMNHKNVSAWNMKRLIKVVKNGVLTTLDERVLDGAAATEGGDEAATQIRSEREAIRAARKIFRNVAKPKAKFIHLQDLMRFLQEESALRTLDNIEGAAESEKISKAALKSWVVNAFLERRALALTLNDTKTAVNKLHRMLNIIVAIIIVIICLMILEIATGKVLLYISSQIVVVAFIFGNTCKIIFEAVIFVFVMHPFDVGDRCDVDGVMMVVEEMNILTTVFLKYDNTKIIYPNVTLATKPISNYYRSPDMGDAIEFAVHVVTPAEKIAVMKKRIISYVEKRTDHWYPEPMIVLMNLEQLHIMRMAIWLRHRMNYQNIAERWTRRANLVEEMVKIFKELDIEYRLYPMNINIRAMPPLNSGRLPPAWAAPPGN